MRKTIALLSFYFHEIARILFARLVRWHAKLAVRSGAPLKWRTMSDDFEKPGFVLAASVLGPRWNCHALVAALSPIPVREVLAIDFTGLSSRSDSWSLVLYDDRWRTREWIGSTTNDNAVTWTLPLGTYFLSLRFYTNFSDIIVPAVTIDGHTCIRGGPIVGEASRFRDHLDTIRNRSNLYYRLLHYYVFFHLKHRSKSADWLRRQFLPVGNPDTEWYYGHLSAGEELDIRMDAAHQCRYNTYVAFYNWASFPVAWYRIEAYEWRSAPFVESVGYAVRCVRTTDAQTATSNGSFKTRICFKKECSSPLTNSDAS